MSGGNIAQKIKKNGIEGERMAGSLISRGVEVGRQLKTHR